MKNFPTGIEDFFLTCDFHCFLFEKKTFSIVVQILVSGKISFLNIFVPLYGYRYFFPGGRNFHWGGIRFSVFPNISKKNFRLRQAWIKEIIGGGGRPQSPQPPGKK